jgi:hypothetical protein
MFGKWFRFVHTGTSLSTTTTTTTHTYNISLVEHSEEEGGGKDRLILRWRLSADKTIVQIAMSGTTDGLLLLSLITIHDDDDDDDDFVGR